MEPIQQFNSILQSFKIRANCIDFKQLDNCLFFDVKLDSNARVKDLQKFSDEISLALKTPGKPSIKVLHESGVVRFEFVKTRENTLRLFDCILNATPPPNGDLICLLGKDVYGNDMWMDLAKNPHMIVAGTTGSGKSTLLHNIIANLLYFNNAHICLIDPKNIEFSKYDTCKFSNICVGYNYNDANIILESMIAAMEYRYDLIRKGFDISQMPYGVLIIDEFSDLIMQDKNNEFYTKLCKLSQKCRAARISIILATQKPSVNVVNGTIKANFPARIACKTTSHVDSKVILDCSGAEKLLGKGDALLRDNTRFMERFQVAYTDSNEICNIFGGK